MSFTDLAIRKRLRDNNKLIKLNKIINWQIVNDLLASKLTRSHLSKKDKKEKFYPQGRRPYDKLKMFKAILLGQWHSLSDEALEEALLVRNDFAYFCNFSLEDESPDKTTLCRFRNKLIDMGLLDKLLDEINCQLEQIGLKMQASKGAIVDATLIKSAARPRKTLKAEKVPQDRDELQSFDIQKDMKLSADPDARWKKKGNKYHFGYQCYAKVDDDKGFIEDVDVSPANVAEVSDFKKAVKPQKEKSGRRIYYDKGAASKNNRKSLKNNNLKDGIMHKAARGRPLTKWQKKFNQLVSKKRWLVEQSFGTLKRRFKFHRTSYLGIKKVRAQMQLKAICFNLLKAVNLVNNVKLCRI